MAPAVVDRLGLGQRVSDQREQPDVGRKDPRNLLGRGLALGSIGRGQQVQRLGLGHGLAVDRETQARNGLVEQARPGAVAHDRQLVEHFLGLVGKLVRTEGAHLLQPGAVAGDPFVFQQPGHGRILDAVELQAEEDQAAGDVVDLLADALLELADRGIGHVAGIEQLGIAADAAHGLLQRLVTRDRPCQPGAVQCRDPALEVLLEGRRFPRRTLEIGRQRWVPGRGIEIAQIPFGKIAEADGIGHGALLEGWGVEQTNPSYGEGYGLRHGPDCPAGSFTLSRLAGQGAKRGNA